MIRSGLRGFVWVADPPNPRNCRRNPDSEVSRSAESPSKSSKSKFAGLVELQIIDMDATIDLQTPRGAPDLRNSRANTSFVTRNRRRNPGPEVSRSAESPSKSSKSRFVGLVELQIIDLDAQIYVQTPRGAPDHRTSRANTSPPTSASEQVD